MKTSFATVVALMALPCATHAAPRLVISTPSLAPESAIDLVLDRPVIAPDDLGKTVENTWLEIKPALPGKLVWKAQNIANFQPDHPPAIGTTYSFSIPKEKTHLDQTEIPAGEFAKIESEAFTVRSANTSNRYSDDYSPSTAEWLLFFNDDVDPAKAGSFITFTSKNGKQVAAQLLRPNRERTGPQANYYKPWSARFKATSTSSESADIPLDTAVTNALVATPISPLPVGEEWKVSVLKGMPNATGNATTAQDSSYEIGTIKPFAVTSLEAIAIADEPRSLVINFNAALPSELPKGFLEQSILLIPKPENLRAEVKNRQIRLLGDFSSTDTWNLTIKPPFSSSVGIPLAASATKELKFPVIDPELLLPSENEAQLSTGKRIYPIQTTNLEKLHIRIKRLSPADLVRTYQGYRHYTGVGHDSEAIEPTAPLPYSLINGETIYDQEISLDNALNTTKGLNLKWDEVLPKDLQSGSVFLDIVGTPKADLNANGHRNAQAIIQLTDIGLAWKLTQKEAFIYAFSCATGQPLKDVTIDLFGEDSATLKSIHTDASGLALLPRTPEARHIRASLNHDSYITAFDSSLNTVGLWHFPVRYSWNTPAESVRRAFLFTDRSLYRPGETVRLKGVVRTQVGNEIQPAAPAKARVVIIDPTDKEIFSQPVTLSDTGSFDLAYALPDETTGSHIIRLEFPEELEKAEALEDDWALQQQIQESASFELELRVEEFRRNAFEIEQTITKPAIGATTVTSDIAADYYQGQPVAAGTVKHYTRITSQNPYPERFRDFLFGNHKSPDWSYWYHYFGYRSRYDDDSNSFSNPSNVQGEATLSPEGKATLTVELPQSDFPTSREVQISAEVTDVNHQTLTSTASNIIHPSSIYVGISRNDRLIRAGENVTFRLVAIDPEGNPYPEPVKLTATLSREVNQAVRSKNEKGDTITRNDTREEDVLSSDVTLDPTASTKEGQEFSLTPKENGKYFLTLRGKDKDGRDFATVSTFHVYGANDYPWLYEDGMRVKLIAEKKSYKPGETARILVLSPIEGTALVTVEREKVLRSFLQPLKADNPVIEIPLTEDDAPNAYVSVLIVKGAAESAREFKSPQLRLGYCELTIDNVRDRLNVSLNAAGPERDTFTVSSGPQKGQQLSAARPGDTVTLSGTVTTADGKPAAGAELTLYAEDEGTLAVMGYETPNPMGFFYDPRILGIEAGVSFNNFLSEDPSEQSFSNKGFFIGGGADLTELANLYRNNFDPCATWAPVVTTGADGTFSHTFKVPDTLTRYRVIAIAHSAEKFGNSETGLVVNKPLMLEPKNVRFANQGDTFSPQVLVQNASTHNGTWEVTFSTGKTEGTPTCRSLGDEKQTITLNAGASATLTFPVTAENTGTSTFSWKAVPISLSSGELTPALSKSLTDAVENTFEVNYPMPILRQVKFVKLDKAQNLAAQIDPALLSGTGDITLEFSRSPLSEITGSADYLLHYPYGCVEQTTSSLIPWFAVDSLRSVVPSFAKVSEEKRKIAIQKGADRLLTMQLSDGSFSYWPGRADRVDWATPYAGLGLVLAKQHGANVPQSSIDQLAKYLTESLRGVADLKSPSLLENQARALWVLALIEKPQASYQSVLLDRIADLSPSARAFLALAYNASGENPATAKSILTSKVPFRLKEDSWMRWNADDSFKLLAWSTIDPQSKEALTTLERMIHDRNPYGHWNTTWANGWSLLAMAAYAKHDAASLSGDWTAELNPTLPSSHVTLNQENPTVTIKAQITPDLKLDINPQGIGYVRIKVAAKPRIEPIQPVAKNGLSIDRIYERIKADGSSEILTEPKVGDLVRVSLRITLPKDDTKYLVVEDMLPSIFETVNTDFKTQGTGTGAYDSSNNWEVSHSELRTDRAVFFLDQIWKKGTYTLTYLARCTVPGEAMAPPAKAEGMYDPDYYALSASRKFKADK